jgi:hypothetical protein
MILSMHEGSGVQLLDFWMSTLESRDKRLLESVVMFGNIDHFVGAKCYEQTIDVESMDVSYTYQVNCLLYPNCTERVGNAMKPKTLISLCETNNYPLILQRRFLSTCQTTRSSFNALYFRSQSPILLQTHHSRAATDIWRSPEFRSLGSIAQYAEDLCFLRYNLVRCVQTFIVKIRWANLEAC